MLTLLSYILIVCVVLAAAVSTFFALLGLWQAAEWCRRRWDKWLLRRAGKGY